MIVNLMPPDIQRCREAAKRRVDERIRVGALFESELDNAVKRHYGGCLGEYAVCKRYECEWTGEYFEGRSWDTRVLDTAVGEVRATFRSEVEGGMRFYPEDDRVDFPYIWVALHKMGLSCVRAKIVGWAYHEGNLRDEWWRADLGKTGAWIVPRDHLNPMSTLPSVKT